MIDLNTGEPETGQLGLMIHLIVRFAAIVAVALCFSTLAMPDTAQVCAADRLTVRIDLSDQRMTVSSGQRRLNSWPVSTARRGYRTPVGVYRPVRLERMWYSTKYDNAPMPHSVFFHFGYAIHGTNDLKNLGRPASHGCVRLHPKHARTLFQLIKRSGRLNTRIIVQK